MTTAVTRPGSINVDVVGNTDVTKLNADEKLQILQKDAEKRSGKEIEFLKRGTEEIKFFKETVSKLGFNTHDLLCQRMYYEFVPANQNLFEAGSMGTTFYIILKGKVGVIIKLPKPGKNELEPTEVAQLPTGASFGELLLMEAQLKPRAATILCKEDCHFAVLDKKPYQEILGMAEKKKLDLQIDFLLGLDVFKGVGWSRHSMQPVVYLFKHQMLKKGNVLYKEGESSEFVMVVRQGEVKFTKQITIDPRETEEMFMNDKSEVISYENKPMQKIVDLAVVGQNQFFGDDEAFFDMPRQSNAIVNSIEAEIWIIAKKEFIKKLHTFEASLNIFAEQAKAKKKWRDTRVSEICQITNKKINPDMLIGAANKMKNAVHQDAYSKMKTKFFNRKQAKENIANKAAQAEFELRSSLVPTLKHISRPSTGYPAGPNNPNGIIYQAEFADPQLFYHNDQNNTELKAFLDLKLKGPNSEENKSRILYSSHSQVRPASAFQTRRNTQPENNMDSTVYQSFTGAYRPGEHGFRQQFHMENPNLMNLLPKGWNPNATYSKFSVVHYNVRVNTAGSEQLSSRQSKISRGRPHETLYDAEAIINQTLEAKKKIQQQLQRESFASSNPKGLFDMNPSFGKANRYTQAIQDQSKARTLSPKIANTANKQHFDAPLDGDDDGIISRRRISSKADDHSHKIGDFSGLLKLLPKRLKHNPKVLNSSIDSQTDADKQKGVKKQNKSVDFAKLSEGEKKTGPLYDQVMASNMLPTNRNHSAAPSTRGPRFSLAGNSIQIQEDSPETIKNVKNLRYASAEAAALKAAAAKTAAAKTAAAKSFATDRPPVHQENYRTRLYEHNIVQQYRRRGYIAGRQGLTLEQEKEKVMIIYEKTKKLKLRSRMIKY